MRFRAGRGISTLPIGGPKSRIPRALGLHLPLSGQPEAWPWCGTVCCVHMCHSEYAAFLQPSRDQLQSSSLRDQCEKACWLLEAECVALQHHDCGCHGPVLHRWLQTEVICTAAPVINLDLLRGLLPSMVTERHHRLTGGDGCVGLECVGRLVGACFAGHLLPSTDLDGLPCRTTTTHRSAALTHCDPHVTSSFVTWSDCDLRHAAGSKIVDCIPAPKREVVARYVVCRVDGGVRDGRV